VERLQATSTIRDEFGTWTPLWNPDGPRAAEMLLALKAERDMLRERLQPFASLCEQFHQAYMHIVGIGIDGLLDETPLPVGNQAASCFISVGDLIRARQALEADRDE